MIKFNCKNCGQKIQVSDPASGKNGKCPKCGIVLTVPALADQEELTIAPEPEDAQKQQKDYYEYQNSIINANKADDEDIQTERNLPWLIDIFLYPFSKAGTVMLGILIGVPFFLHLVGQTIRIGVLSFPALIILLVAVSIIGYLIRLVLIFYGYWYICECIRDSCEGSIRAPETIAKTPDIFELLKQFFYILICFLLFAAPSFFYWRYTKNIDTVFWTMTGVVVFFFPMTFLAVIMFDSLRGLNPLLILPSIISTFISYCGLILFITALSGLFVLLIKLVSGIPYIRYLAMLLEIYAFIVEAHLLGRFYFKYQEKLYWDV
jgi:hypothetical protein